MRMVLWGIQQLQSRKGEENGDCGANGYLVSNGSPLPPTKGRIVEDRGDTESHARQIESSSPSASALRTS